MTDVVALELRRTRLAESVTLRPVPLGPTPEGGPDGATVEGVFVALDDSPPVRTVLAVVEGDRRRALEVAWVVEVAERDEVKGFYGRWVADEALARAMRVGTEHLEDGMPVVQPVVPDHSAALAVSDAMAMPAPVLIVDDTGVVDIRGNDEDESEDAGEASETAQASPASEAPAASEVEVPGDAEVSPAAASNDTQQADTADHPESVAPTENVYAAETVSYSEEALEQARAALHRAEAPAHVEASPSDAAEGTNESTDGEGAASESTDGEGTASESTDAGETTEQAASADASSEPTDASASTKGGRKKRSRKRR